MIPGQTRITVCASGCDYASVNAALAAAGPGDTVAVMEGSYRERVVVGAGVRLTGAGPLTVLDGGGSGPVVAIDDPSAGSDTQVSALKITGGRAAEGAGIRIAGGASPVLSGLVVQGNEGTDTSSKGGGLYLGPGSAATIRASAIYSNTSGTGGGLYLDAADARLEGVTVAFNRADLNGGGLHAGGGAVTVVTSTFLANSATGNGGGLHLAGGSPVIDAVVVAGFNAALSGGGVAIDGGAATLRHSRVISNTAGAVGGGVFVTGGAAPTLFNDVLAQNLAVGAGAGVGIDGGSDGSLSYSTIVANRGLSGGNGDGIYLFGSGTNPTIRGNIIVGNSYGVRGPTVGRGGLVPNPTLDHNDVWNNGRGDLVGVNIESSAGAPGSIAADPLLVDSRGFPYALSQPAAGQDALSPAVDAGGETASAAGLAARTTRTDGVIDGGAVDLGFHSAVPDVAPTATPTQATPGAPTETPTVSPTPRRGHASVEPSHTTGAPDAVFTVSISATLPDAAAATASREAQPRSPVGVWLGPQWCRAGLPAVMDQQESIRGRAPSGPGGARADLFGPRRPAQPGPLVGYRATVAFDTSVIAFVDARAGGLLTRPGGSVTQRPPVLVPGGVTIGADVEPGPGPGPAQGSLAVLTFKAKASGSTPLSLEEVVLSFPSGDRALLTASGLVDVRGSTFAYLPMAINLR
jgi:parallel beta-helix repeat protein